MKVRGVCLSAVALFIAHAAAAQQPAPRDSVGAVRELNAAYAFRRTNQVDSAVSHFRRAAALDPSDDRARNELRYLLGDAVGTRVSDVYASAIYQSRFSDLILSGIARTGRVLDRSSQLTAYASARATRDTRSTGGAQPVIYSDNVAIAAAGLRVRPGSGPFALYAEAGPAFSLTSGTSQGTRFDVRAGGYYADSYRTWDATSVGDFVNDSYADASYYSRYEDGILYAQLRPGVRVARGPDAALDVVSRVFLAADTRGDFYNNLAEGGGGLRLATRPSIGVSVYAEAVFGSYLRDAGANGRTYHDFRLSLIYGSYSAIPR